MTFDEFKTDLMNFLDNSTVNLGRKSAKTRTNFLDTIMEKLNIFNNDNVDETIKTKKTKKNKPVNSDIMSIKPKDSRKALSIGKGVHSMTASESMRADEQLNRSPYSPKRKDQ